MNKTYMLIRVNPKMLDPIGPGWGRSMSPGRTPCYTNPNHGGLKEYSCDHPKDQFEVWEITTDIGGHPELIAKVQNGLFYNLSGIATTKMFH